MKINITATYAELIPSIKRHISVVGKRARTIDGKPMYSDLSPSSYEEPIFNDLIDQGAETIVANLVDLSASYSPIYASAPLADSSASSTPPADSSASMKKIGITFSLVSDRWLAPVPDPVPSTEVEGPVPPAEAEGKMNITSALSEAIHNYLYSYALAMFFSAIHPTTGAKYPPIYAHPYEEQCQVILGNIRSLAREKRRPVSSDYSKISSEII